MWYNINVDINYKLFILMNDATVRYVVALLVTFICLFAYYSGYVSGKFGWWWTVFGALIIFGGAYKIVK